MGYSARGGSGYGTKKRSSSNFKAFNNKHINSPVANFGLASISKHLGDFNINKFEGKPGHLDFSLMEKDDQWWYFEQDMVNNSNLIAQKDGKVVGVVSYSGDGEKIVIDKIVVAPEFRKHGVSKSLIDILISQAGKSINTVMAYPLNDHARSFFHKIGFTGDVAVSKSLA